MGKTPENSVFEFSKQHGIDLTEAAKLTPRLAVLDKEGSIIQEIAEFGAVYTFFQIDYCEGNNVHSSRMVAVIQPGNRTEVAYWTVAAPEKALTTHRGRGRLIIGDPIERLTRILPVDNESGREVTLPPGRFYTIKADEEGIGPLVISGLYDSPVDWDNLEISLSSAQNIVEAPEGRMQVPPDFWVVCNGPR